MFEADRTQWTRNESVTLAVTSTEIAKEVNAPGLRRTMLAITNTSAAAVATLAKGNVAAIAGAGIILQPNGTYIESDDNAFRCWQGGVQVIGSVVGTVSVVETFGNDRSGYVQGSGV